MRKGLLSISLAAIMVAGIFSAVPAQAVEVPAEPNIVDQEADANYHSSQTGQPGSPSLNGADLLAVWFTHDAENLYAHFQTTNSANIDSINYAVEVDPGVGAPCVGIWGVSAGNANDAVTRLDLSGDCGDSREDVGEFVVEEGPDETAIWTATIPRDSADFFGDGQVLATPEAFTRHYVPGVGYAVLIDTTDVGTDYKIGGGDAPPAAEEPPADDNVKKEKKLTKKDCKKIKNKKKRKRCLKKVKAQSKKEPKGDACPAYTPGEQGAEAETVVVTDEHSEEAPLELAIEQGAGVPEVGIAHAFANVQVDTAGAENGLYIRYEFPVHEDHDLYVNHSDGSEAAHVGGFNVAPVAVFDGTGSGGHSEQGAEQIDGLRTADCAGYTLDLANYLGEGGEYTVKMWLGEIQNDPAAPGGGARSALELMQETLR